MKFDVDTGRLARTVSNLSEKLTRIEESQKRMYTALESLDGMWAGEAHDAFKVQYVQDDRLMTEMISGIRDTITDIGSARQEYDTCEEEVKQMALSIRV